MKRTFITTILFISVSLPAYGDGFLSNSNSISNSIFALFSFALVLALAYFTTKFLSKKMTNYNKSEKMNIVDTISIDNNNKISIVKILEEYYVISINNNGINLIDKLDTVEILLNDDSKNKKHNEVKFKFESILSSLTDSENKKVHQINNCLDDKNVKLLRIKEKVTRLSTLDKDV